VSTVILTRVTLEPIAVKVLVDAKGSSEVGPTPNPKGDRVENLLKLAAATAKGRTANV
jgi:hypothetical protein